MVKESKIEHCSEPNCPECKLKSYNRGKKDARRELMYKIDDLRERGYEPSNILDIIENDLRFH